MTDDDDELDEEVERDDDEPASDDCVTCAGSGGGGYPTHCSSCNGTGRERGARHTWQEQYLYWEA